MRRWLSQESVPEEGESLWTGLTAFLEKELKVSQQTSLMMGKHKERTQDQRDRERDHDCDQNKNKNRNDRHASHYSNQQQQICHICGATDHVATNGPGGSKLIQYFVCSKFANMTNKERFNELRSKGFCFQCLFPGARKDGGKHKEGKCQRDFVCKHSSHDKFSTKKHVLVCEEHKSEESNKEVLQAYKDCCILRQNQVELPSYSKEISLNHTFIHKTGPIDVESTSKSADWPPYDNTESIYILQTIKVNGQA